jgi:starch phosphorylase
MSRDAAVEVVSRTGVFTTHTPVPAGNECFDVGLLRPHLEAVQAELGIPADQVIRWGQAGDGHGGNEISMTVLGLRMAHSSNGVSELHGVVARNMWQHLWPNHPKDEVPIGHVTNGVHVPSWISPDTATLFNRYLGDDWRTHPSDRRCLASIGHIPDEELWRIHELNRSRLVRRARELLDRQLRARNSPRTELSQAKSVLDHDVLTIGFARRFATYKRATLLLREPERLEALLCNEERPVQLIFAGKAHPADDSGKEFIRRLVEFAHRPHLRRRVVFLENYDIAIARYLVQGCDVWLNTPRRPLEASGTSGMKAAVNGVLNCSVLDGWWCEGYAADCGWAIGSGEQHDDTEYQDMSESQALFNILENEIVPMFYDRESGDLPSRWLSMMKASVKMSLGFFTSHRMLEEYDVKFYSPACETYNRLMAGGGAEANRLVAQRKRLSDLWSRVACSMPLADYEHGTLHVGDRFTVTTEANLGGLKPEEVDVEVYYGPVNSENHIVESHLEQMEMVEDRGHGRYAYRRQLECRRTGRYGFTARVIPHGPDWRCVMPGFMRWADGA